VRPYELAARVAGAIAGTACGKHRFPRRAVEEASDLARSDDEAAVRVGCSFRTVRVGCRVDRVRQECIEPLQRSDQTDGRG
jgi:hypothetical protein